jgi:hypothetical protein
MAALNQAAQLKDGMMTEMRGSFFNEGVSPGNLL